MSLRVSGKNINIGEALRTHVTDRVNALTGKYFDGSVTGHVTISPEGPGFELIATSILLLAWCSRRMVARKILMGRSINPPSASRNAFEGTRAG